MFLPYRTESIITHWPIGNFAIIGTCVLVFALLVAGLIPEPVLNAMILHGWNPIGLVGSLFLHAGIAHIFFNMLFLWVFGNAVCETVGDLRYVGVFLLCGVIAGATHNIFSGQPAVGASGAINGIVGFYLVMFPTNKVDCFYWFFFRFGTAEVTGYWLVLLWFLLDAWGALWGSGTGVAYWAHLGGLAAGIVLGVLFEKKGWASLEDYDNPSLITLLFREREKAETRRFKTREELLREYQQAQKTPTPSPVLEPPVSPPTAFTAECPHCAGPLELSAEMAGTTIQCPGCSSDISVEG